MQKFKKFIITLILILPLSIFLFACSNEPYIVSLEKTKSIGTTDTYTITYSNGDKKHFSIENGKNGQDGTSITIEDIKNYCEETGKTVEQFFKELEIEINTNPVKTATNKAMQSAISLYTEQIENNSSVAYAGSGVIYKMEDDFTYIITNYHVTHNGNGLTNSLATKIVAYQYGEREFIAKDPITGQYVYDEGAIVCEYVGGSDRYDIAVIKAPTSKILSNNPNAAEVEIADNYALADTVIAIGNPSGDGLSATEGIVSVVSETIDMYYEDYYYYKTIRVMRIDAAVNGGNSGGGLFNTNGELVGIVNAKIVSSDIENIAYALPVGNSINVAESIIYNNVVNNSTTPTQAKFNIKYTEDNFHSVYNKEKDTITLYNDIIIATEPASNGLGARIGFEIGDIVKSATVKRGETETTYTFNRSYELTDMCLILREGDGISFVVNRNETEITIGDIESTFVQSGDLIPCDTTADYVKH